MVSLATSVTAVAPHWNDRGTMLHSWLPFKAPASNDVTAPVALDIITAITCVSDSCHTCASKSSKLPSPSRHQMIQLKSWVCHLQLMSPSCLKECRTSFTVLCIVPDNKGDTSLWCPCQAGRSPTPLGWSHRSNTCWPCTWICLPNEHQCSKKPWFSLWSRPDWTVKKILLLYRQYLKTGLLCPERGGSHVAELWLGVATVRLNSQLQIQGFRRWDLEAIKPVHSQAGTCVQHAAHHSKPPRLPKEPSIRQKSQRMPWLIKDFSSSKSWRSYT